MKPVLGVSVGSAHLHACVVRGAVLVWAARASYATLDELTDAVAALAAERPTGVERARIALMPEVSRVKEVEGLPRLSRRHLADHVRLNSRRYFLQNGLALITDARPMPAHRALGRAQMIAAPAPVVEAVLSGLAAAGLACDSIIPAGLLNETAGDAAARLVAMAGAHPLQLLPDSVRRRSRDIMRRRLVRSWLFAAGMVVIAMLAAGARLSRRERSARGDLASLDSLLRAAIAVESDLAAAEAAVAAIQSARSAGFDATQRIAALARHLPDSAFITHLRLDGAGAAHFTGYAVRSGDVLRGLERAEFRGSTLEGTVTRELVAGRQRERFTITSAAVNAVAP